MVEQVGIKETKELAIGLMHLAALLAARFKDGVQVEDFAAIMVSLKDDPAIQAAIKDVAQIPAEIRDISIAEGFQLGAAILAEVPALIEVIVKPA